MAASEQPAPQTAKRKSRRKPDPFQELRKKLDPNLLPFLDKRDGASQLSRMLPVTYSPEQVNDESKEECRAWELAGLYYMNQGRPQEALAIFVALYDHMLVAQEQGQRVHKATPLVWIYECYLMMGFAALPKRYLMLSLCEDAITKKGIVPIETSGVYIRAVWRHGLADSELKRYTAQAYKLSEKYPTESLFPEWVLQELDKSWMIGPPAPMEAAVYSVNPRYVRYLIGHLGDGTGTSLERLADYLLSCMPGCRTTRRGESPSTDYDVICSIDGLEVDFRSELGRYFVCECKDWQSAADFTTMAKFCRVLDSMKSRFGILFSKNGLSGQGKRVDAELEQLKVFQDRGMVIVVIDQADIERVANGESFIGLLRTKYERVRLNLVDP